MKNIAKTRQFWWKCNQNCELPRQTLLSIWLKTNFVLVRLRHNKYFCHFLKVLFLCKLYIIGLVLKVFPKRGIFWSIFMFIITIKEITGYQRDLLESAIKQKVVAAITDHGNVKSWYKLVSFAGKKDVGSVWPANCPTIWSVLIIPDTKKYRIVLCQCLASTRCFPSLVSVRSFPSVDRGGRALSIPISELALTGEEKTTA